MRYAVVFTLLGAGLALLAFLYAPAGWLLLWPAGSFLVVAAAYAGLGPKVVGQRGWLTSIAPAAAAVPPRC
ncbi:MAG TPA: hypothetical protein VFA26_15520 [Gemmataceae bacterium]|nr:hypothetical protein [Gemmataceae bacterium]